MKKGIYSKITIILVLTILFFSTTSIDVLSVSINSDSCVGYSEVSTSMEFYVKNANSGQYLDVYQGLDKNNANVQQWTYNGGKNQLWKFEKVSTYKGSAIYKIISVNSSSKRVLDVSKGSSANNQNIALYKDQGSNNQQFVLYKNKNGSYRILSKCSNFNSGLTVKSKSCSKGGNVIQYNYNGSHNDEWYLEPVKKSNSYGITYARKNATISPFTTTYPDLSKMDGDCANFVSQCMVASGIHYQNSWYVYKKNNQYLQPDYPPKNSGLPDFYQLDYSWKLEDPSPWISAKYFNSYWSKKVNCYTYSGSDLAKNKYVSGSIGAGDVVQYGTSFLGTFQAKHTMYITGRDNSVNEYTVCAHTNNRNDIELINLIKKSDTLKGYTFRFFDMI